MSAPYPDGSPGLLSKPKMPKLANGLPSIVYAQASPRSIGGTSLFEAGAITARTAQAVQSEPRIVDRAAQQLREAGFTVFQDTPPERGVRELAPQATLNISGPPDLYERAFGCSLEAEERPVLKENQREDLATFVECPQTDMPGLIDTADTDFADVLEGVALEEPRYFFATAMAPSAAYWHLDVPGDVSLGCNADKAHRMGVTGTGVKVVMTDSGHFDHPFFSARGYRVQRPVVLGPGATAPADDESGHGTAESANIFAIAPDADFTMVKMSFFNTIGAFNAAVALNPHIISNSWGSNKRRPQQISAADQALAAAVAVAVAAGITVVFSAGNGQFGFPGQHPDVISAGGVFLTPDGTLRASDYASGFASEIFIGRNSPDLCGLVGMQPRAAYILLPVQPNDDIDRDLAGSHHPNGDETRADDGWAAISGTSAAAPQIAGVCALVKQANPQLTPKQVRGILRSTARDVAAGHCINRDGMGHAAVPGPDLATGTGLVDAHAAVVAAQQP
ncbi:peptidase S8 [Streptomyces cyaneochromogenes]|uniref:Peptidase S8 n=1 Tax=Streptomyces cyaneochromogenes TaxID=2496836 RepID=A0A3S9MLQ4_9ACTN|nr:peptidase S8 [Streptomyces cyaneochromogenes]AZQ40108.1 peptidase S8 [Streptomyces cyaneochromogenes]